MSASTSRDASASFGGPVPRLTFAELAAGWNPDSVARGLLRRVGLVSGGPSLQAIVRERLATLRDRHREHLLRAQLAATDAKIAGG